MIDPANEAVVLNLESCDSTNSHAMRLGVKGEPGPLWVVVKCQTGGRGRAGRGWVSEPGNLHASLLVRFPAALQNAGQLSLVAGIGVFDALSEIANRQDASEFGRALWLKWPNDIMVEKDKCGGILVETSVSSGGGGVVGVIGIGLNLVSAPQIPKRRTTCLRAHGIDVEASDVVAVVDRSLRARLQTWNGGKANLDINSAFLSRTRGLGKPITVHDGQNVLEGSFAGLSECGHLQLRAGGGEITEVGWGDVMTG